MLPRGALPPADRLASDVSKGVLEDVRKLKHAVGKLQARVHRIRTELEEILDDDADMQVRARPAARQGRQPVLAAGSACWGALAMLRSTPPPTAAHMPAPVTAPIHPCLRHALSSICRACVREQDMYLARRAMLLGEEAPPGMVGLTHAQVGRREPQPGVDAGEGSGCMLGPIRGPLAGQACVAGREPTSNR